MKTSSVLLALTSVALASANIVARQAADATVPDTPTLTSISLSPTAICLAGCQAADVNCRAACVGGSFATTDQVDQTYTCIERCDKGDGSFTGNANWASCQQQCINNYYLTSGQTLPPAPVVAAAPETPVNNDDDDDVSTPVAASPSLSRSGTSASSTIVSPSGSGNSSVPSTTSSTGPSPTASTSRSASSSAGPSPTADSAASGPVFVSAGSVFGIFLAFFAL
ncbi:hypothetical protein LZ554_004526 [Drepanopeziza brunnea f. sp. 'monogermtubi']|nr:hypothetical protein LZ554_004526 [Drepanopeziza brunnea f. sp. 'monogermtubi']